MSSGMYNIWLGTVLYCVFFSWLLGVSFLLGWSITNLVLVSFSYIHTASWHSQISRLDSLYLVRYHHIECRFSYGVLEVLCEGFKITPRARMLEFSIGTYSRCSRSHRHVHDCTCPFLKTLPARTYVNLRLWYWQRHAYIGAHDCWLAPTFFCVNVIHYCIETYLRVHVRI
jgi:hypothetical protein